jgi:hypothetical protein
MLDWLIAAVIGGGIYLFHYFVVGPHTHAGEVISEFTYWIRMPLPEDADMMLEPYRRDRFMHYFGWVGMAQAEAFYRVSMNDVEEESPELVVKVSGWRTIQIYCATAYARKEAERRAARTWPDRPWKGSTKLRRWLNLPFPSRYQILDGLPDKPFRPTKAKIRKPDFMRRAN